MEKWTIKPAPTSQDPRRHVLLLQGTMKDVTVLLKRFGAMCGRPAPEKSPEGYNFSLFLHGLNEASLERVKAALGELGGAGSAPAPAPVASPSKGGLELERFGASAPAPAVPDLPPPPIPAPPPVSIEPPPLVNLAPSPSGGLPPPPPIEPPALPPIPSPGIPPPPAIEPPPLEPPKVEPPPMPSLAPTPAPAPVEPPKPVEAPPPPPPTPVSEPAAAGGPPSQPASGQALPAGALANQPLFGLMAPIDPTRVFESLQVGAYNRFAHAAATSVIGSPGTMYNPLFLYGAPGVGKSHMATAIVHGLGAAIGKESVILTTGARLGRAVSLAMAAQKFGEIEAALSKAKALVVDDLHLLSVTDGNTTALAKVFAMFFSSNLQVVLTAMYPPRSLGALEEALKISFGKGWSVDLKVPNANVQREIVHGQLDRAGMNMTNDEVTSFIERLGANYGEAGAWVRRLVLMHKLSQRSGTNAKPDELMAILFNPDPPPAGQEMPSAQQLESVKGFNPPVGGGDAPSLIVVLPKLHEHLREWVIARFFQASAQYRIQQSYRVIGVQTYDAQQPFGVPFAIGEICARSGAQSAIIVGPPADSQLAARLGEFSHAVGHILESMGVRMAWLAHNGTMSTSNFLRAQLDAMPDLV